MFDIYVSQNFIYNKFLFEIWKAKTMGTKSTNKKITS